MTRTLTPSDIAWNANGLAHSPSGPLAYKASGPAAGSLAYRAEPEPEGWPHPSGDVVLDTGSSGSWAYVLISRACLRIHNTDTVWHTAAGDQRPGTWQWWEKGEWRTWRWLGVLSPSTPEVPALDSGWGDGWEATASARYAYGRDYLEPSGSAYFIQNVPSWARRLEGGVNPDYAPTALGLYFDAEYVIDPETGLPALTFFDRTNDDTVTLPRPEWDGAVATLNEMTARVIACGDN